MADRTARARAMWMEKPGILELRTFDVPTVGDDDGVLRVEIGGVCGTDLKILHGTFGGKRSLPVIPGHEIVGIIEDIGPLASQRWGVGIGDRVAVDSFLACGACDPCLLGDTRYCLEMGDYGISMSSATPPHLFGGFADYVYLPRQAQVFALPEGCSPEVGVLIPAVVSNALRWVVEAGRTGPGSSVLILGPGPIGLAGVVAARAAGAAVVAIAGLPHDKTRLALAKSLGADVVIDDPGLVTEATTEATGGRGFDTVVDLTGSVHGLPTAVDAVRRQGTIVVAGLAGADARPRVPIDDLVLRDVTLRGQFSHDRRAVHRAITFVERSDVDWERFVTHRYPLEETAAAIDLVGARDPDLIKVVVDPTAAADTAPASTR